MPSSPSRSVVTVLAAILAAGTVALGSPVSASGSTEGGTTTAPAVVPEADPSPPGPPPTSDAVTGEALAGGLPGDRPNIVVIMTDDMRADELAWMPNVQRLIEDRGVRFANAFSQHPLCCPARASFLTGQYTHNHGVWSNSPDYGITALDDSSTVATDLAAAGYQTAFLGKYLNGYGMGRAPNRSGDPLRYVPPGWHDWRGSVTSLHAPGTPEEGGTYNYFKTTLSVNGALEGNTGRYQTRVFGDETADLVRGLTRSPRPFFLWSSYVAPHAGGPREPDDPEPVIREDGEEDRVTTPARPKDVRGLLDEEITQPLGAVPDEDPGDKPSFLRDAPTLNQAEIEALTVVTRQRAESLHVVDQEVARTLEVLERAGELQNTLVVFVSDNGYLLGEHGALQGKNVLYESAIRVPLLVAGPGIPAGEERRDPFLMTDFAPTFLELAGARTDRAMDGTSMLDVLRDGDRGWTRPVLTETGPSGGGDPPLDVRPGGPSSLRFSQGLRTPHYLYAEHATRERELYDLRSDPEELTNLADRPGMSQVVARLARVLDRMRMCRAESCAAPLPRSLQQR
ncbi:MAG: sulfatase [Nocardioidaceae bacterium]